MRAPLLEAQEKYNNNSAKVDALINWIFKLKKNTTETEFSLSMDSFYKELKSYYEKHLDLAKMDTQIKQVELGIKEAIDSYNKRIKSSNVKADNTTTSSYNSNTTSNKQNEFSEQYKFQTTFDNPLDKVPLRELPDIDSRITYMCPINATVYVIDNPTRDVYFKVYVNGYTGYLSKGYLKRKW